ncbi:MAG TPA: O-antigen ligase family protein [Phycisphaerae bacterium]
MRRQDSWSEKITEILLWGLAAFLPWLFGGATPAGELGISLLITAIALCLLWQLLIEKRPFIWSWAYLPLMALAGLAFFSLIRLPESVITALSPESVRLRAELLSHLPFTEAGTLSLYPPATAHMLRLLTGASLLLIAVVHHCRTQGRIVRLLSAVAIAGGMLAGQALLQDMTSPGKIYWSIPAPVKSSSGPFVNYNNYGQFMNLSIGCGVALLLMYLEAGRRYRGVAAFWEQLGEAGRRGLSLLIIMLLGAGLSILLSGSRGGVLSRGAGGAVVLMLVLVRRDIGLPLKVLSMLAMGLVFLLLGIGFESFMARMETLADIQGASGARWQVFKDVLTFAPKYAGMGTGLGTHEFIYPMISHLNTWRNAQYVENEYIQLFEEMGVPGILCLGGFMGLVGRKVYVGIFRTPWGIAGAGVGLAYGLTAVAVGSVADFGQRIASVSCLTAMTCGMIIAIGRMEMPEAVVLLARGAREGRLREAKRPMGGLSDGRGRVWKALLVVVPSLVLLGWMMVGTTRAAMADYYWQKVRPAESAFEESNWTGSDAQYASIIGDAQSASAWEPDNVIYRSWTSVYRLKAASRAEAWEQATREQNDVLMLSLLEDFQECERLCPTYAISYAMAGQIRNMSFHDAKGMDEIDKAYRLNPTHGTVCFIAGRASVSQERWEDAGARFHAAIRFNYGRGEIERVYLEEAHRADKAIEFFDGDWQSLFHIANLLKDDKDGAMLAGQARARAGELLSAESQKQDASVEALEAMADLLQKKGEWDGAIGLYRRAINGNFASAELHLALAQALAKNGQSGEALEEIKICLHLKKPFPAAEELYQEWRLPAAHP